MKHLSPSDPDAERTSPRQRFQNLPFQEWKVNVTEYLRSVSWTQWGFVAIATFGYIVYLVLAVSVGIFLATILFLVKLMLRVDWDESVKRQGIAYWLEQTFAQLIKPLIPRRVRAGAQRRAQAYRIHNLVLSGAVELARPNRVTFVLGCVGLALLTLALAQQYFFPPDASAPSVGGTPIPNASQGVDYD